MASRKRVSRKRNQDRIYRIGITVTAYKHKKSNGRIREGFIVRTSDMKTTDRAYFPKTGKAEVAKYLKSQLAELAKRAKI